MFFSFINQCDLKLFKIINQPAGLFPFLDVFAIFCGKYLGYFLILFLLFLLIKNGKKYQSMVLQSFFSALFSRLIIVNLIRWFFPRERPFVSLNVNLLFPYNAGESSFPSGHTAFYFALSTVVYYYNKTLGSLFYFLSFFIGFFRIFSGVHWPLDIVVGALVGVFSGCLVIVFSSEFLSNVSRQKK